MCRVYNHKGEPKYVRLCYKRKLAGEKVPLRLFVLLPGGGSCGLMKGQVKKKPIPTREIEAPLAPGGAGSSEWS